jgi:serine/threonine protein kinase
VLKPGQECEKSNESFVAAPRPTPEVPGLIGPDRCDQHEAQGEGPATVTGAMGTPNDLSPTAFQPGLRDPFTDAQGLKSIGPYQLVKRIGEGGMGEVWLAEQTAPVRRQVALKLIRAGMCSGSRLLRFQSERQSLAMMEHPAIARVFEAGSTPEGQPYLVMEHVAGPPITDYCDQKKLKIRDRLELFIKVCEGVQHAHQKAIIHRDLKPANILVVEIDGKPMPRIIDFGLAKTAASQSDEENLTLEGSFVGTPGYMSPEQADPGEQDVDTRTDVYSLGVVLYVLLTGFVPFDAKQWRTLPLDKALRQLREQDPPRPSTKVGLEKGSSSSSAAMRSTEPRQLASLLEGDLDWIAMKAIEKDRTRRYGTPSELAADISRYLNHEPVMARPASPGYRLRKYLRRHRIGVAVAAGLVLLLAGFAAVQATQLRRITRERDRADRVTEFMSGMFRVSDPSEARGNSITAREILDRASRNIDSGLARDPELQAQMMDLMGTVYRDLGLYSRAQPLLERSVDTRRRLLGSRHPQTLSSLSGLGMVLNLGGRHAEAEKLQRETLDIQRRVLGPEHPDTLRSMNNLSSTLDERGRFGEAEKLQRETLAIRRRVLGPEHPDTLMSLHGLGRTLIGEGRKAEAEQMQRETLDMQRRVLGVNHSDTLLTMNNLAWTLGQEHRYDEAAQLERETLEIQRHVLGPEHPDTIRSLINLSETCIREGRYAEAEQIQRETLDSQRRVFGPEHFQTLLTMSAVAWSVHLQGRYPEAEKLERQALDIERRVLGPEHPNTLRSMSNLAATVTRERRYAEAEKLRRETLEVQRRVIGPEHPEYLMSKLRLATNLLEQGRYGEAEKLQREILEVQRRVLGPEHLETALTLYNLACTKAREGNGKESLELLSQTLEHGLEPGMALGIDKDPDLNSLHGNPRFEALVARAKERAAATQRVK